MKPVQASAAAAAHPTFRRVLAVMAHLAKNADKAPQVAREVVKWGKAGFPLRTAEQLAAWQAMCEGPPRCPHHLPIPGTDLMHCAACKCPDWKARLLTAGCPLGRTPASPLHTPGT